ncbi:acyl-CoA thioesterase II [Mycolicibacter sp. MYC123]|uniref:Acyl-CoA thioesterase II n=1 Tax=[Mycobacterium] zoologicum TaxID=2872311 RepID=A0ABU5YMH5_9MYCO|nr:MULTISPECIES: acyl-CoA thioesterase II [unclassified Mycolicibacter]MEB3051261.1 acyl-CoA thioesterase II [Mycolicibacter sp. MYC123]MEB3064895.1 acyl-CoA thioesterase II [Mycolicibacter sp. MYC101]
MAIQEILDLEQLENDIFRSTVVNDSPGIRNRAFGGRVAGQSLVSAVRTVDPRYQVHSLHGYFLRPGDPVAPTVFLVERVRDGSSFCTRRVSAVQHGKSIFHMQASFQVPQLGIEHQNTMPSAPEPDSIPEISSMIAFDDEGFKQFEEWDLRRVPRTQLPHLPGKVAEQQVWFRHRDPLPDDPVLHICALAYMSDLTLLGTSWAIHPKEERDRLEVSSLDHAMWFLRPFRADEWLLYDESSPSAVAGRALCQGKIYNRSGDMVAAVMQEGLTRFPHTGAS